MPGNRGRTTLRIPRKPTVLLLVVLAAVLAPILASPGSDHAWQDVIDDAFAHVLSTLVLTDAGKITDTDSLECPGICLIGDSVFLDGAGYTERLELDGATRHRPI